jgi:hypothetical protein
MAREAEARVLRATDEELEELARGPMGGGPAGSRSVAELAAQERWRRKESRRRDEEMRTAALASTRAAEPRPGPLDRLALLGHELTDGDRAKLTAFIRAVVREELEIGGGAA